VCVALALRAGGPEALRPYLAPHHFWLVARAKLYGAALELQTARSAHDLIPALAYLDSHGEPMEFLRQEAAACLEAIGSLSNVRQYAQIVRAEWATRQRVKIGRELANGSGTEPAIAANLLARLEAVEREAAAEPDDSGASGAILWASTLAPERLEPPASLLGNGVLCRGDLGLIAGAPGRGKSRLSIELGIAMARCEPWLGMPTTSKPARVGYIACEFMTFRWVERLVQLMTGQRHTSGASLLEAFKSLSLWAEGGLFHGIPGEELKRPINLLETASADDLCRVVDMLQLDCLILDPLARMMAGAEEDNANFGLVIQTLDRVRFRTGATVHLVHHARKSSSDAKAKVESLDMIRGGTKLRDGVNTALFVSKLASGTLKLEFPKANYAAEPEAVYHTIPEDGSRTVLEQSPDERADATAKTIARWCEQSSGEFRSKEVAAAVQMSDKTAKNYLAKLVSEGTISCRTVAHGAILYRKSGGNEKRQENMPFQPDERYGE
jgi:hypothetical protein